MTAHDRVEIPLAIDCAYRPGMIVYSPVQGQSLRPLPRRMFIASYLIEITFPGDVLPYNVGNTAIGDNFRSRATGRPLATDRRDLMDTRPMHLRDRKHVGSIR